MKRAIKRLIPGTVLVAVLGLATACASNSPESSGSESSAKKSLEEEDRVSDAQAVAIARALNDAEVDEALLAKSIASSEAVREYASTMATDHAAANDRMSELTQRLQLLPVESAQSRGIREQAQKNLERLRPLTGDAFDRTYVRISADGHQQALDVLDQVTADVREPELAKILGDLRTQVAAHLVRARQMLSAAPLAYR